MTERLIAVEGPMFSSKTLELIKIAQTLTIGGKKIQVFKPFIDDRGEGNKVIESKFGGEWPATPIKHPYELLRKIDEDVDVVLVDEVQFFKQKDENGEFAIVKAFGYLLEQDIEVVYAGLPRDFRREPFGPMPELMSRSQKVITLDAVCDHVKENGETCTEPATETQRFVDGNPANWNDPIVKVGAKEEGYAARCIHHHHVEDMPKVVFDANNLDD